MLQMYFTGNTKKAMALSKQSSLDLNSLCGVTTPCIPFRDILKELIGHLMEVG
jgi:hypothetical protein